MAGCSHRVGMGWDAHAFGGDGPLRIGGVNVPFASRLMGHSDADVLVHAICDALLGAAGLDDIGTLFPATDIQYENIDSLELLRCVGGMLKPRFSIVNIDSVVIAQQPPLAGFIPAMRKALANTLHANNSQVGIKAKSPEGLGSLGRVEGIAAHAVALLEVI